MRRGLPADALDVPIADLHLDADVAARLTATGARSIGDLVTDTELRPWVRDEVGGADERLVAVLDVLAAVVEPDGTVDWPRFWSERGVTLIPETDSELSPAEVVEQSHRLIRAMLLADQPNSGFAERSWKIVDGRAGLVSEQLTLERIAGPLELTRERVRQIERDAVRMLKAAVSDDLKGRRFRLRPLVARSVQQVLALGPSVDRPIVREDAMYSALGIGPKPSELAMRRARFLFKLGSIDQLEGVGPKSDVYWYRSGDTSAIGLLKALDRTERLLCGQQSLALGGTPLEIADRSRTTTGASLTLEQVERVRTYLSCVEDSTDGRLRARVECLDSLPSRAQRLLVEAGGPLNLREILRGINSRRLDGEAVAERTQLSSQLSRDDRFIALPHKGYWGLRGRDEEHAESVIDQMVEALRRSGQPTAPRDLERAVAEIRPDHASLVRPYLYQYRPRVFVLLRDGRWALPEWPEAQPRSGMVREVTRRSVGPSAAHLEVEGEAVRLLEEAPHREMPQLDLVEAIARSLGRTRASIYYYIRRLERVEQIDLGRRELMVRLRA